MVIISFIQTLYYLRIAGAADLPRTEHLHAINWHCPSCISSRIILCFNQLQVEISHVRQRINTDSWSERSQQLTRMLLGKACRGSPASSRQALPYLISIPGEGGARPSNSCLRVIAIVCSKCNGSSRMLRGGKPQLSLARSSLDRPWL
jgi:hypothetical protein